jgi:hypothetical protein
MYGPERKVLPNQFFAKLSLGFVVHISSAGPGASFRPHHRAVLLISVACSNALTRTSTFRSQWRASRGPERGPLHARAQRLANEDRP